MKRHAIAGQSGFSLVEAVIALVVLAAAAAGGLLIYAEATSRSADPMIRAQAQSIATAYMDEIMLQAYSDPDGSETGGAEAGEARPDYDDVWDYRDIGTEPPTDRTGTPVTGLGDYSVTVTIGGSPGSPPAAVTINVVHDSGKVDYRLESEREDY